MKGRPGRPRKAEDRKLQPVSTSVEPAVLAMLQRIAARQRVHVSEVLRRLIVGRLESYALSRDSIAIE